MLVSTSQRLDRSVATVTLRFDNVNTAVCKKYKCLICDNVVFEYYDTFVMNVEGEDDPRNYLRLQNAITVIECTHRTKDDKGHYSRCRTFYTINRG